MLYFPSGKHGLQVSLGANAVFLARAGGLGGFKLMSKLDVNIIGKAWGEIFDHFVEHLGAFYYHYQPVLKISNPCLKLSTRV